MPTLTLPEESDLYRKLVRDKALPHPTARNFDRKSWQDAFRALPTPSLRDKSLAVAAIHYGTELQSLRAAFDDKIFKGLNRCSAKMFSVAFANREYFVLSDKIVDQAKMKARDGSVTRLDGFAGILVSNPQSGDKLSADSLTASIVDTLPHCIERAQRIPFDVSEKKIELDGDNWKLYPVLSIEHSIRNLWQSVLWRGASLTIKDNELRQVPGDKALAEYELAWTRRIEGVAAQGALADSIAARRHLKVGIEPAPYLRRTVIGVGSGNGGRSLKFGEQSGRAGRQPQHRAQITVLEDSYLSEFLDATLPATAEHQLSCRELHNIWCVLADAAEVLRSKKKSKELVDFDSARQFALLMRTSELERAVVECGGISAERAGAALRFLSLDGSDTRAMFADGFWSRPVLTINENESALISPALFAGNPLRRVEHWLSNGGLADHLSDSRRGLNFEAHVRSELVQAMEENELFFDSYCAPEGINTAPAGGEQIDILFRIRDLVVVGEVKCFLAPAEDIEHANYLRRMKDACDQAARKAAWLKGHHEIISQTLGLSAERAKSAVVMPIVVTNQSYGASLSSGESRVIDFHFLKLYLEDGEYLTGVAYRLKEGDAVPRHEKLYASEEEAEQKFLESIENLRPLKRYLDIVKWTETRFPLSNGETLFIENCVMEGNLTPMNDSEIEELFE